MIAKPLDPASFRLLADEEAKVVTEFVQLLKEEQQALIAGQVDDVSTLSAKKAEFCQRLDRFSRHRIVLLSSSAINPGPELNAWLSRQDASVKKSWATLLTIAKEAQDLNRQNGQLISSRMQSNSQTLNVLMSASDRASLYGSDGQPRVRGGGRFLGKV